MDIKAFLKLLARYKWLLILVPLFALTLTFFFVKNLPKEYISQVQMSTGLVDQSRQVAAGNQNSDYFKVSQQFSNIMEMMKMKRTMSSLSYSLILHDLTNPKDAFKEPSELLKKLKPNDINKVITLYNGKLENKEIITTVDESPYKLYDLLASMGYDEISINKNLSIYRIDNSDFINVDYTSENPLLSAFVVNTLSNEFINSYGLNVSANQNISIAVLDSLVKKKEMSMNNKNAELRNYKINNGVLNLDKQSEIIYKQITDYEERKSQALREIQSNQGAIANLNRKLNGTDNKYLGSAPVAENKAIIALNAQIKIASNRYLDNGFKPADKRKIDSLQNLLSVQMDAVSDNYVNDPVASKQSLIQQKNSMEIAISLAQNSLKSIDAELNQLKLKYNSMVPFDAGVQNYERDADLATKEYMDALNRYNQSNVEKSIGLKLQIAQMGLPGPPEPSKKMIYMALSGISSFAFCVFILFTSFILDNSVNNARQFANLKIGKVLGNVNYINEMDPRVIWGDDKGIPDFSVFKGLMRSLRFEISKAIGIDKGCSILGITSIRSGEGKTFFSSSLAYAFAMTGKKVLLIGDDFMARKPSTDETGLVASQYFENFLVKKEIMTEDLITFLNKSSSTASLLEIQSSTALKAGFEFLRDKFDVILVDVDSLRSTNQAKEWLSFTDYSIAVFAAGSTISESDKEFANYIKNQEGFIGWIINKVKNKELKESNQL